MTSLTIFPTATLNQMSYIQDEIDKRLRRKAEKVKIKLLSQSILI